jgi:hypothetical protein
MDPVPWCGVTDGKSPPLLHIAIRGADQRSVSAAAMKVTLVIVFSTWWRSRANSAPGTKCGEPPRIFHHSAINGSRATSRVNAPPYCSDLLGDGVVRQIRVCGDGMVGEFSLFGVSGNIRAPTQVWLSEALMRNGNYTETLDEQIVITWRGCNSVNGDRKSLTRRNADSGAGRIRLFPSGRKFRNCICTSSATRNHCCRSGNSGRSGISTIHPFINERTRNFNQTLVGTDRPPSAARRRCSHIHVSAGS